MNTSNINDLKELATLINDLPMSYKAPMAPVLARIAASMAHRTKVLDLVQQALGQLRLDVKYMAFDLEATRRERDTYKEQLEAK
jgi:nitrate reductase beta subunit